MKKPAILFLFLLTLFKIGYTQGYIHLKRGTIKKNFLKHCKQDSIKCVINDGDSLLVLSVIDPFVFPIDVVCCFNKKGKCVEQITKLCCDSCSDKLVKSWMNAKRINWHLIDSTHYISGMGKNLLFTIIDSKTFSVKFLRPKDYFVQREKYNDTKQGVEE